MEKKTGTYVLPTETLEVLDKASKILGISKSRLIKEAVENYIKFELKDKLASDMDTLIKDLDEKERTE